MRKILMILILIFIFGGCSENERKDIANQISDLFNKDEYAILVEKDGKEYFYKNTQNLRFKSAAECYEISSKINKDINDRLGLPIKIDATYCKKMN